MITSTIVKKQIIWKGDGVDGDAQRILQLSWMLFLKIINDQYQELAITEKNYRSPIAANRQWRKWTTNPEGDAGGRSLKFVSNRLFPELNSVRVI